METAPIIGLALFLTTCFGFLGMVLSHEAEQKNGNLANDLHYGDEIPKSILGKKMARYGFFTKNELNSDRSKGQTSVSADQMEDMSLIMSRSFSF